MSDLIDRQAAIESIKECAEAAHSNHEWDMEQGYLNAIECIEEEPPAQLEQQWIPCSERLPEKEGWYITTIEYEKTGRRKVENDLFAVEIAIAHGHTPNIFCKDRSYGRRTIAWMPFPKPYKGESK